MHDGANVADPDLLIGDRHPMAHADRRREARRVGVMSPRVNRRAVILRLGV